MPEDVASMNCTIGWNCTQGVLDPVIVVNGVDPFRKEHDLRFSVKQSMNLKRGAVAALRGVRRGLTLF